MKINDSTPLIPAGKEPGRIDVVQKSPLPAAGPKAEALKGPGVKEELKTDKSTDKILLDKIRAKIEAGEFEIDYQKIAKGMLGDTIAALGSKVRAK